MTTITARTLINRAVVSVTDGEKVGTVSGLHLDLDQRVVMGLLMGGDGGIFNRVKASFIPFAQVRAIGPQAVTIEDKSGIVVAEGAPYETAATLDSVKKRVVSTGGEVVGDGDDVAFDDTTGALTALMLTPKGGFLGVGATTNTIPIASVVGFGRDVITVAGEPPAVSGQ
jgi:sporulation protein YlmC with PRC-barrel domain